MPRGSSPPPSALQWRNLAAAPGLGPGVLGRGGSNPSWSTQSPSGVIGSRAGFKIQCPRTYGFKSHLGYI